MYWLYELGIRLYGFGIWLSRPFSTKAKAWIDGRKNWPTQLQQLDLSRPHHWLHCASLGEYEQGVEVMRHLQSIDPRTPWLVSFFSPSGYLQFRDHSLVTHCFYLPLDTRANAEILLSKLKLRSAIFVKSEIWPQLWMELHRNNIPIFQIAARYSSTSRTLGSALSRKCLALATAICCQDRSTLEVLKTKKISNAVVTGNPRYNRVIQLKTTPFVDEKIEGWRNDHKLMIAGSTWTEDFPSLYHWLHSAQSEGWKLLLAPHDQSSSMLRAHLDKFDMMNPIRYSHSSYDSSSRIMILDTIGRLSRSYRYANIAYVGGGWKTGLHSTLEPAVYQIPIVFGPEYRAFPEAVEMINRGVAFSIDREAGLSEIMNTFDDSSLHQISNNLKQMFQQHTESTSHTAKIILNALTQ